jgi:hypothetical protein
VWNGSSWAEIPAYNPSTKWNYLNAIKCPSASDCEAVGSQSQHEGYGFHPLAEAWNGRTWSGQPVQGPHGAVSGRLDAVACASSSSCEAVGSRPSGGGGTAALAVRRNGPAWSFQKMPAVMGRSALSGVSCYRAGYTAAGTVVTTSGVSTLAEAWNGSGWTLQSPVGSGNVKGATWNAIHCDSAANCTVVGAAGNLTLAETWNGRTWAKDSTPSPGAGTDELVAMSCTPGTGVCTAVGAGGVGEPPFAERN